MKIFSWILVILSLSAITYGQEVKKRALIIANNAYHPSDGWKNWKRRYRMRGR